MPLPYNFLFRTYLLHLARHNAAAAAAADNAVAAGGGGGGGRRGGGCDIARVVRRASPRSHNEKKSTSRLSCSPVSLSLFITHIFGLSLSSSRSLSFSFISLRMRREREREENALAISRAVFNRAPALVGKGRKG